MATAEIRWEAEKSSYATVVSGIIGREIRVLEAEHGELGYTKEGNAIYVAKFHPLFHKLSNDDVSMLRYGVCIHEAMHQVFTNFDHMKRSIRKLQSLHALKNELDVQMYCTLVNLVEDPAIEDMAESVIGGTPLNALEYSIRKIYELSEDFSVGCKYPIEEVLNALIQFGDLGILKGDFTFNSAKKVFLSIIKPFYDAMRESDGAKRIDAVFPIYAECARLWAGFSDNRKSEMMGAVLNQMKGSGKDPIDLDASGAGSAGTINENSKKQRRQKQVLEQLKNQARPNTDAGKKGNDQNTGQKESSDSDPVSQGSSESEAQGESQEGNAGQPGGNKIDSRTSPKEMQTPASVHQTPSSKKEDGDDAAGKAKNKEETVGEEKDQSPNKTGNGDEESPAIEADDLNPATLSEKDQQQILDSIFSMIYEVEERGADETQYYRPFPSYKDRESRKEYDGIEVENHYVDNPTDQDRALYKRIVKEMQGGISQTVDDLRDIFLADRVRKTYCESGKACMKRFASGKITTRMFEKKRQTGQKKDMCVAMIGDHSGSMRGSKLKQEMCAVIALAEIFAELEIPFYFMGFNVPRSTPRQTHYIRWNNTETERFRLTKFCANGCNFDSYSIRYAGKLLEERPERHKLLFVLSDGLPSLYESVEKGILANIAAIQDVRTSDIGVIGFGIGKENENAFERMYGKESFIRISNPKDMFGKLAGCITDVVKEW